MDDTKPSIPYWHVHTDVDGMSRQARCEMRDFERKAMADGAAPQWIGAKHHDGMSVVSVVLPVGWVGDWHENPAPQWIIPLSGRWFVETMDGTRVEMGPGDISFGEDQGCKAQDGRVGHLSGTVGDAPCVQMVVQFDTARETTPPCRFG